jgi:putative colanic acid biosynthesis UDP-glucose lipid carrier transferase
MRVDAEKFGPQLSKENDPRITSIGLFLRKTRLDEFPQFFNVLIGDMSVVGPRPERQFFIDQIIEKAPYYKRLQKVKPGITGWAQINGFRGETDTLEKMEKRVELDLYYIERMSIWLDLKIIVLMVYWSAGIEPDALVLDELCDDKEARIAH